MGGSVSGQMPVSTRSLEPKLASFERRADFRSVWNRLRGKSLSENGFLQMQADGSAAVGNVPEFDRRNKAKAAEKSPRALIADAQSFKQLYRAMHEEDWQVQAETGVSARRAIESIKRTRKYVNGSIPVEDAMSVMKVQLEGELKKKVALLLDAVVPYEDNQRWTALFIRNTFVCAGIALLAKFAIFGEGHSTAMVAFIAAPMAYTLAKAFILPARTKIRFEGEKLLRLAEGGRAAAEITRLEKERAARAA